MKKIFTPLFLAAGFMVHAQAPGKNVFLGVQSGMGEIEDPDLGSRLFYQEYGISTEIESASRRVSLRLLPTVAFASGNKTMNRYGYTNSLSTDYLFCDFSANVRFSAPVRKFRVSLEFGPGISFLWKSFKFSSTELDYSGKPINESRYSRSSLFSSNFGTNVSYDCSSRIRVWLGVTGMFRIDPLFWIGDSYGTFQGRLGIAWRFGSPAVQQ